MFDFPEEDELYDRMAERRREWFKDARSRDVVLVGGGVEALMAGLYLEKNNTRSLLLAESEHLGERLIRGNGPVPIFPPAVNRLEELDYPLDTNPPVWVDRNYFLSFLVENYLAEGGRILRGVYLEGSPRVTGDEVRLTVNLDETSETFGFDDLVLTLPRFEAETLDEEGEDPLTIEVRNTRRRSDGTVQAGRLVLPDEYAEMGFPLESADLLSGRKAAEIILNDRG